MNKISARILSAFLLLPVFAMASTITFNGPTLPNGTACTPGSPPDCVIGNPLSFDIFSASLTSPTTPGGTWHLEIQTNYGTPLPGNSIAVPTYSYEGKQFGMADFMIQAGGEFYAVVISAHDGYAAGNLYKASGFQTSQQVMGPQGILNIPRPNLPALLNAGGSLQGAGTITASQNPNANGVTSALYKISVDFAAPVNFLSTTNFTVYAASYVCDNGFLTGTGGPFPPGGDKPPVPEPATWTLTLPVIAALAMRQYGKKRKS